MYKVTLVLPGKTKGKISRYKICTPILGLNRNYSRVSVTTFVTNTEKVMQLSGGVFCGLSPASWENSMS